jgi:hypothetical protein
MTDKETLEAAYLAGFNASGEGYNGEYPFQDHNAHPEQDADWVGDRDNKLSAIKQALALDKKAENARELGLDYEPVQEPLEYWNAVEGWVKIDEVREHFESVGCGTIYKTAGDGRVPLTAAQRQPLTAEAIWRQYQALWPFHPAEEPRLAADMVTFARAIEAAHGIKENT